MNDSNKLKVEFVKYLVIGRVKDKTISENWFKNGIYPEDSQILQIINTPIDNTRLEGLDWPQDAVTMIGLKRMNNIHESLDYIRENNVEGDLMETGVWKGGATIFMKLYCDIYGLNKKVFVCDSFEGLPKPSGKFKQDEGDTHYLQRALAISLEEVRNNFVQFRCLDENVVFIKGFFGNTLPNNDLVKKLSLLRMDGDMYESTYDVFYSCYDKLNVNGICIIDDYCLKGARECTDDFRRDRNIQDPITVVDRCGVYWTKSS